MKKVDTEDGLKDFYYCPGNEAEIVEAMNSLEINNCVFLYSPNDFKLGTKKVLDLAKKYNLRIYPGILLDKKSSLKQVQKASLNSEIVVVDCGGDPIRTRMLLEKTSKIWIYGMEDNPKLDFMHFRNSGVNHIFARMSADNKTGFLFNLNNLLNQDDRKQAVLLGRLRQNIMLYKKYNVDYKIVSFAEDKFGVKKGLDAFERVVVG